jgi:hydroxyacyl-ACP dehydratase HTD2-like protein with hotdog domain
VSLADQLRGWSPEPVTTSDPLDPGPATNFSALLDLPSAPQQDLPPLWHWFHFLEWPPQRHLGPDGHLANSRFLPPIPDRRRMFAGGRLTVHRPLRIGEPAEQRTSLAGVTVKQGRTGELAFVTVRGDYHQHGERCLTEEQDLVYRSGPSPATFTAQTSKPPESDEPWRSTPDIDSILLFRFSALTANAHRIHYDQPYCREIEGYPDLVVHGPLLVLLMLELVRPHRPVDTLSYRLRHPVFLGDPFLVAGGMKETAAELAVTTAGATNAVATVR